MYVSVKLEEYPYNYNIAMHVHVIEVSIDGDGIPTNPNTAWTWEYVAEWLSDGAFITMVRDLFLWCLQEDCTRYY